MGSRRFGLRTGFSPDPDYSSEVDYRERKPPSEAQLQRERAILQEKLIEARHDALRAKSRKAQDDANRLSIQKVSSAVSSAMSNTYKKVKNGVSQHFINYRTEGQNLLPSNPAYFGRSPVDGGYNSRKYKKPTMLAKKPKKPTILAKKPKKVKTVKARK
jgi:hypothetical protein